MTTVYKQNSYMLFITIEKLRAHTAEFFAL